MATVKTSDLSTSHQREWRSQFGEDYSFELPAEQNEPELNLKENNNFYEVEIGVPGLGNKDFFIKIENGTLTISSEKNNDAHEDDCGTLKLSIAKPVEDIANNRN